MTTHQHASAAGTDDQRCCPVCASSFVPHPRKPSQTYCTERCRAAAWRQHGRQQRAALASTNDVNAVNHDVNEVHDAREVRNRVGHEDTPTQDTRNVTNEDVRRNGETTAVQHCPHCRQPITVITLIVPPTAAHVAVPQPPPTVITNGRYHRAQTRPATGETTR